MLEVEGCHLFCPMVELASRLSMVQHLPGGLTPQQQDLPTRSCSSPPPPLQPACLVHPLLTLTLTQTAAVVKEGGSEDAPGLLADSAWQASK